MGEKTRFTAKDPYHKMNLMRQRNQTSYGYTNEYTGDYNELVYLRARFYATGTGRFLTKDPSGAEANLYLYAAANPINMKDPAGLFAWPGLGFGQFAACFSLHTASFGNNYMPARAAVDVCKEAFSKNMWNKDFFDLGGNLPTTAHNLFGWYLFEQGNNSRLDFGANERLTQELSRSRSIHQLRMKYYLEGDTPATPSLYYFNISQQIECLGDAFTNEQNFRTMPLSCLLGSFYYQIKTDGDFVGFRIDNRTDLGSGTHIPFRFDGGAIPFNLEGAMYGGSVEELLDSGEIPAWMPLMSVINKVYGGRQS